MTPHILIFPVPYKTYPKILKKTEAEAPQSEQALESQKPSAMPTPVKDEPATRSDKRTDKQRSNKDYCKEHGLEAMIADIMNPILGKTPENPKVWV